MALNYTSIAFSVLAIYDFYLTLCQEIELIWSRGVTAATIIYALNRYLSPIYGVSMILQACNWSTLQSCTAISRFVDALGGITTAVAAVFSSLRVFAISHRNWTLALITLALGLAPSAMTSYITAYHSPDSVRWIAGYPVCLGTIRNDSTLTYSVIYTAYACMMLSELAVLITTWYYAYYSRIGRMHLSALCSLLLRDGTFYFFCLLDLSLAEVLLQVQLDENFGTSRTYFIAPLAPILIARFLLNLRMLPLVQGLGSQELSYDQSVSELPSIVFASRMLGNIGAPLDDGLSDASDWENRTDSDEDEDEDESS